MTSTSVFDYLNCYEYLNARFSIAGESRGMRLKLAKAFDVSASYITKILDAKIKISVDKISIIDEVLEHNEEEADFFLLLVLYTQAEEAKMKRRLKKRMDAILQERKASTAWIPEKVEVPEPDKMRYYSHWHYMVIHALTMVPAFQTKEAIAKHLRLSLSTVTTVLEFLRKLNLVELKGNQYVVTHKKVHLGPNAISATHAYSNIHQLAIYKLIEPSPQDIHYSAVISVSRKNGEIIERKIRQFLREREEISKTGKEEETYGISLNFFKV